MYSCTCWSPFNSSLQISTSTSWSWLRRSISLVVPNADRHNISGCKHWYTLIWKRKKTSCVEYNELKWTDYDVFTCLLVPFPWKSIEIALCTRPSFGDRFFSSMEARRQRSGLFCSGCFTNAISRVISVGRLCTSSSHIVSQLKNLTASMSSLSNVSRSTEHKWRISSFTCLATLVITGLLPDGDVITAAASDE